MKLRKSPRTKIHPLARSIACSLTISLTFVGAMHFGFQSVQAADATWNGATDNLWATQTNWSATPVPAAGNTATFDNAGNANTTIDLGSGVNIGSILFDTNAAAAYTIGAGTVGSQTLTFSAAGVGVTMNAAVIANQLFNAAIALEATSVTFANHSTTNSLTFAGGISASTSGSKTLTVSGAGATTISGIIANGSGTVSLVKTGNGTLTLSGANTFTGGVTLNAGTLRLGNGAGAGTGTITLNGGTFGASGTQAIGNAIVAAVGSTTIIGGVGSGFMTYTGVLSGSGALQFTTSGFNFNIASNTSRFTGSITTSVAMNASTTANNTVGSLNLSKASVTLTSGGSIGWSTGGSTAQTQTFMLGSLSGTAGTIGGSSGSNKSSAYVIGYLGTDTSYAGAITNGNGGPATSLSKVGSGTLTLNGAATSNVMTGGVTVREGTLQIGDGGSTAGGFSTSSNALTFLGAGGRFNYVSSSAGSSQGMAALTFSAGDGVVQSTNDGSGNSSLTFSNVVARTAGATANFVVSGGTNGSTNKIVFTQVAAAAPAAGVLLDKGYYFGGSDFAAYDAGGFVRALAYGTDTSTTAVDIIASGTHVKLTASPTVQSSISLLTLNLAGSGISWTNDVSQTLTLSGGGLIKSGGGSNATISGGTAVTTGGATELAIRTDTASDALDIQTVIPNTTTGGLTKSGKGTLTLSATGNAWTGATNINQGTVNLSGTYSGNSAFTVRDATLNVTGSLTTTAAPGMTVGDRAGNATVNINGTLTVGATGVTTSMRISNSATGNDSATATVNVNSGGTLTSLSDLVVGLGGTQTGRLVINSGATVNVATTLERWLQIGQFDTVNGQVDLNSGGTLKLNTNGDIRFSSSGGGGTNVFNQNGGDVISYSNNGTTLGGSTVLDLQQGSTTTANNTYNLNGGTLAISQVTSVQTNGTRTFNFNGGTLKVASNANAASFFNLGTGNARANVRNGGAIIDTNGINVTVAQALVHSNVSGDNATDGGLTKQGTGTLTLTATNTYTGATTVNAGTILVSGSISGSTATVNSSGTLGGAGGTTGAVIVNSGGTLSPGASIGTLNSISDVTLNAGSTFKLEIDTTAATTDVLAITGNLSLANTNDAVLTISDLTPATLSSGSLTFMTYTGTWNGGLFTYSGNVIADNGLLTVGSNQFTLDYNYNGNSVALIIVPEPGAAASLFGSLGLLVGLQRFRRRHT